MDRSRRRRAWLHAAVAGGIAAGCGTPDDTTSPPRGGEEVELARIHYYTDPTDPAIADFQLSDGRVVGYFGEKDATGRANLVSRMVVASSTDSSVVAEVELDREGRPLRGRVPGQGEMVFDWSSPDSLRVTISYTVEGEQMEVTRAVDIRALGEPADLDLPTVSIAGTRTSSTGSRRGRAAHLAGIGVTRRPDGGRSESGQALPNQDIAIVSCGCEPLCGTQLEATWGGFPLEVEERSNPGARSTGCVWNVRLPTLPDEELPDLVNEEICPLLTYSLQQTCRNPAAVAAAVGGGSLVCAALIELPPAAVVCEIIVLSIPLICTFSPLINRYGCDILEQLIDQIRRGTVTVSFKASHPVWGETTVTRDYRLTGRGRTMFDVLRESPVLELPGCDISGEWREQSEGFSVSLVKRWECQGLGSPTAPGRPVRVRMWLGRPLGSADCPLGGSRSTYLNAAQYGQDLGNPVQIRLGGGGSVTEPNSPWGKAWRCTGEDSERLITDCGAYQDPVEQGFRGFLVDPNRISGVSYAPLYDAKQNNQTGEWFDCVRRADEYREVPVELRREAPLP